MMRAMKRKYKLEKSRRKGIWRESGNTKNETHGTGCIDGSSLIDVPNTSVGVAALLSVTRGIDGGLFQ